MTAWNVPQTCRFIPLPSQSHSPLGPSIKKWTQKWQRGGCDDDHEDDEENTLLGSKLGSFEETGAPHLLAH